MSKFNDIVKQDTPRLVVMFRRLGPNQEQFQWGMVGQMPLLTLIGYITRVQAELAFKSPEECSELALVIVWDAEQLRFSYFIHPDIPVDSMVGMLETIKGAMVDSRLAQQAKDQQVGLYGPDGKPIM